MIFNGHETCIVFVWYTWPCCLIRVLFLFGTRDLVVWCVYCFRLVHVTLLFDACIVFVWYTWPCCLMRVLFSFGTRDPVVWYVYCFCLVHVTLLFDACIVFVWYTWPCCLMRVLFSFGTRDPVVWYVYCFCLVHVTLLFFVFQLVLLPIVYCVFVATTSTDSDATLLWTQGINCCSRDRTNPRCCTRPVVTG